MKYCVYCGREIGLNTTKCPYCDKDVSDDSTKEVYHSNIKCIKCKSTDVDYKIVKSHKKDIIYEEEVYVCKKCGKKFKDKNRLGSSFSNNPQIILSDFQQKVILWVFCIFVIVALVNNYNKNKTWIKMDCNGLPTMTFKQIKEGSLYDDDKYKNNSYIFTTTVQEIKDNEIITPIEEGDYSGSYIKVNRNDLEKLSRYKEGDRITFCGTVKKISLYNKVYVENATIIE